MKSKEIQEKTGLTRKAIEYYEAKGLICPSRDESGYREYSSQDVSSLSLISRYRKLGLNLSEISSLLRAENKKEAISNLIRDKEIRHRADEKRIELLSRLANGESYKEIEGELISIAARESVYNRITNKFPGYLGQMLFVNYAPFLQGRLETDEQTEAFNKLINFLDNMEDLPLTEDEIQAIFESAEDITTRNMEEISDGKMKAISDTEKWMKENREVIQQYQDFKTSDEYQSLPIVQVFEKMKKFLSESGFYETVIPLLRKMSPAYDEYYRKLIAANEFFVKNLNN